MQVRRFSAVCFLEPCTISEAILVFTSRAVMTSKSGKSPIACIQHGARSAEGLRWDFGSAPEWTRHFSL